jgi:glyceraldehyde 3-phosphate dehydrogenase
MKARVGIHGFGRMGRLALRAAWRWPELEFAHVNETKGSPEAAAHLLKFDSVHGRWGPEVTAWEDQVCIDGRGLSFRAYPSPGEIPWGDLGIDLVVECSGKFRTAEALAPYFRRGVRKVIVAAPVYHVVRPSN